MGKYLWGSRYNEDVEENFCGVIVAGNVAILCVLFVYGRTHIVGGR